MACIQPKITSIDAKCSCPFLVISGSDIKYWKKSANLYVILKGVKEQNSTN